MIRRFAIDRRIRYWLMISLVYLSLIYSAGLAFAFGPDTTVSLAYFQATTQNSSLQEAFPDLGSLRGVPIDYQGDNMWKLTGAGGDAVYYLLQTKDINASIPPFKYRFLAPMIAVGISKVTGISVVKSFIFMNIAAVFISAILLALYLQQDFRFSEMVSFIGGILFVTMVAVTKTVASPMLEPMSLLFAILIFIAVKRKNAALFIVVALGGVFTKEILVVSAAMWFVETWQSDDKTKLLKNAAISIVPILGFMVTRGVLGGAPLEVNYGFDILKGEFPGYVARIFDPVGFIEFFFGVFLAFSFIWAGVLNARQDGFFKRQLFVIPLVILATLLLSSRIARVLGVVYPLVIPMFLLFVQQFAKTTPPEHFVEEQSSTP